MSLDIPWMLVFGQAGFGFGADAFFTTLVLHRRKLTFWNWVFPIFVMHSIVPATESYLLRQFGSSNLTVKIIGTVGFVLITFIIFKELRERIARSSDGKSDQTIFAYVLAVSWDILLGFTAMQPTIVYEGWSVLYTSAGYLFTGALASGLSVVGMMIIYLVKRKRNHHYNTKSAAQAHLIGDWMAFSFIGSFGIASGWQGWVGESNQLYTIAAAATILGLVFWRYRQELGSEDLEEAEDLLS